MILSERSRHACNPLEEDDAIAEALIRKGRMVIQLNRGDPPVYFPTPDYIKDAYIKAIREGKTHYAPTTGIPELKNAVARRYKRRFGLSLEDEDVVVTQGVSEALYILNASLLNPGNHVIVFRPYYTQYIPQIELAGGRAYHLDYRESENWDIDTKELEKHIRMMKHRIGIKYIMITNPSNPTGTVLKRQTLKEIVDLANEHNLIVVSDEVYDEIVYNGARFTSVCELAKGIPYVILNGASKDYDATGFRIGFMIVPNDHRISGEIKKKFADFASVRISANAPAQYATAEAMNNTREHRRAIGGMVKEIARRVNFAVKLLNENPYLSTVTPNAAFYIFPRIDLKSLKFRRDKDFVDALLREKCVQITRGSGFGVQNHIRIVSLPPKDILEGAITKINEFCRERSKG